MEKFKKISDKKISEIATKHNIDVSIIIEISDKLAYYIDYLHDSFKEFKELPFSKNDELPWSKVPEEWAELSLFYHENLKEIEMQEPRIFSMAVITPINPTETKELRLSKFVTNQIIKTYLDKMASENLLFDKNKAKEVLNFSKKLGKRQKDAIIKRNEIIKLVATILKRNGITRYSPVVNSILIQIGFVKLKSNYIRRIAN
ncbi:MAG: hypothetical protein ACTSSH_11105 [Candidatus Heimdallarchaeota archaeon]